MRRGRRSYKFTGKTHSKRAVVVFAIALVTLITYLVFVYQSFRAAGQLSAYYGAFGVFAMIVAMVSAGLSSVI